MLLNNDINSLQNNANPAASIHKSNQLTQDDFIKLLLTQMRLQTPENPFDSNTMMQQISQLTTLSATTEMEKTVKSLNDNLGASQVLSAAQLVGKQVQVPSGVSPLINGQGLNSSLVLPSDVEHVTITIKDSNGQTVKTMEMGPSPSGIVDFNWNGLNAENKAMPPGMYNISGTAVSHGESIPVTTAATLSVNSVAMDRRGQGVVLNIDGLGAVNMNDIIKIM